MGTCGASSAAPFVGKWRSFDPSFVHLASWSRIKAIRVKRWEESQAQIKRPGAGHRFNAAWCRNAPPLALAYWKILAIIVLHKFLELGTGLSGFCRLGTGAEKVFLNLAFIHWRCSGGIASGRQVGFDAASPRMNPTHQCCNRKRLHRPNLMSRTWRTRAKCGKKGDKSRHILSHASCITMGHHISS